MATAYSYIRFSSKKQSKGDSLRRQKEWAETYCAEHGHTLDRSLKLHDLGVSAMKGKNAETGALATFLKACENGRIKKGSLLLVENLDRLSRNEAMKAINLIQQIVEAGVTIVTRVPERELNAKTVNDFSILIEIVVTAFRAHEESKTKGFRVAEKWDQKRKLLAENPKAKKMTGKGPSWLRLDEDGKTWRKIPARVAIVKQIFGWAAQGLGAWQIVQRLNAKEVPTINRSDWTISSLLFLLRSRSVVGEFQAHKGYGSRKDRIPQGDPIPDYYPRIIEDKLFYRVQDGLNRRIRTGRGRPTAGVASQGDSQ